MFLRSLDISTFQTQQASLNKEEKTFQMLVLSLIVLVCWRILVRLRLSSAISVEMKVNLLKNIYIYFFFFLGLDLQHMEFPRLGVKSELQLQVYTKATAIPDLSLTCDLCHGLQQCQILNPLSEARDQTLTLVDTSVLNPLSHNGISYSLIQVTYVTQIYKQYEINIDKRFLTILIIMGLE